MRRACSSRPASPAAVDAVSVLSSRSSAVGPTMTLPNTVGADEHTLRPRRGDGKHDPVHERAGELVEHDQLAASRGDRERGGVPEELLDVVGVQTRGVHDPACPKLEVGGHEVPVVADRARRRPGARRGRSDRRWRSSRWRTRAAVSTGRRCARRAPPDLPLRPDRATAHGGSTPRRRTTSQRS